MIFFSNKDRPFEYGPYPLERLKRDDSISSAERARPKISRPQREPINGHGPLGEAIAKYHDIFRTLGIVKPFPPKAPIPDELYRRMVDVKGAAYFLDVAQVGICEISENVWLEEANPLAHTHAVVIVQAYGKYPEKENLAHDWCKGLAAIAANFRVFEVAIAVAEHIQNMGYHAKAHDSDTGDVDFDRLAVLAGVAVRDGEILINPYLDDKFAVAVVTTDYALATDQPLHASAKRAKNLGYWLGLGGAVPGIEWNRRAKRRSDLGIFPMEQVDRVEIPTTQIFDDEVPRVSKRAAFFARTRRGDLGEKSKFEVTRFAFKHPFAQSMVSLIRSMVPHQYGPTADKAPGYDDPAANSKAMKSLSYFLGSEITGICEIPEYAWYSHKENGEEIIPYHKYAVVMLIDQGFDTMEGGSGDDWISGAQSMRAYLRGAEIAGVMAEVLRGEGYSSCSQTNAKSDVLHIPLAMWAGLAELSRIGELTLNPFIGPRLKTVVMTTNMPLEIDKPIDFGLQYFCNNCLKCARECPCDAIPFGDKVVFNGYEMWKPDVERCARYRLTNSKGSACGRCMKTCPLNKVVNSDGPILTRIASWCGINAFWLKPVLVPMGVWLDDVLQNGKRNPLKKWWFDHEIIDGITVEPRAGTNQRDIDPKRKVDPAKQKMAYYHADMMPAPDAPSAVVVNRKEALAAKAKLETPDEARDRLKTGGPMPEHYAPTPPVGNVDGDKDAVASPYFTK